MTTAAASATPVSLITSIWPATKPENTTTTTRPAQVMIRPDFCRPATTLSSLSCPASRYSLIRESRKTS